MGMCPFLGLRSQAMIMRSLRENPYTTTTIVALAPIGIGSIASYFLTFRCCKGISFVPAPGLGYLRWDISLAIWCSLAVIMTLVALLVTLLCKCVFRKQNWSTRIAVLAVVYAILIHQVETKLAEQAGKHLSTIVWGYDPDMLTPHDVAWATKDLELQFEKDGLDHVQTSEKPILTPEECEEFVSYSISHADAWMNSHKAIPPTAYSVFGGDINFGSLAPAAAQRKHKFEPYRPWHDRAPWLSMLAPRWNYIYGFERFMGRESATTGLNQTHIKHVQEIYLRGLRPYLEKVRNGLARHLGTTASHIVMGGDEDTVLHDFSPPSVIVGLPNYVRQWDNNFHVDTIPWGTNVIDERLEEREEEPCLGGHFVHAGTLALELPQDGAGMLWRLGDRKNSRKGFYYYTPYRLGYIATVPGTVLHSIAPYNYTGWMDTKRITLQMFMLQCIDEDSTSTWYVFH
jgi:hypothetical protein